MWESNLIKMIKNDPKVLHITIYSGRKRLQSKSDLGSDAVFVCFELQKVICSLIVDCI